MARPIKVTAVETLACDAGWRNYHFVKISTDAGIVGWSEFDEGFGPRASAPSLHASRRVSSARMRASTN